MSPNGAKTSEGEPPKEDIDRLGAARHKALRWEQHADLTMKGFGGRFTLWAINDATWKLKGIAALNRQSAPEPMREPVPTSSPPPCGVAF